MVGNTGLIIASKWVLAGSAGQANYTCVCKFTASCWSEGEQVPKTLRPTACAYIVARMRAFTSRDIPGRTDRKNYLKVTVSRNRRTGLNGHWLVSRRKDSKKFVSRDLCRNKTANGIETDYRILPTDFTSLISWASYSFGSYFS